jgi:hypothetical protein
MSVAIIGSGVEVFCCAHRLLDINPNLDVHIFDEKAESGMYGEEPGIFEKWPLTPSLWFGEMFSQTPTSESSAVRYSWFVKSLSIALAKRGTTLHLKSRVKKIENNNIHFSGAGISGSGEMQVDRVIDFRGTQSKIRWWGAITNSKISGHICGVRSDQTVEVWCKERKVEGNFLQRMDWYGSDPKNALSERILLGIETAELPII